MQPLLIKINLIDNQAVTIYFHLFLVLVHNIFFYSIYLIYICSMKRKRKLIDLSHECVERLTIHAVKKKTNFKNLIENYLETLNPKLIK